MSVKTGSTTVPEQRWADLAHDLGFHSENIADYVREKFTRKLVNSQPLKIIAFHGMGNEACCRLQGRVLEYRSEPRDDAESIWKNLQDSYRRFETDEVPDVTVRVDVAGKHYQVATDEEGYFTFEFPCPAERCDSVLTVMLSLPDFPDQHDQTPGTVYFSSAGAAFGVISDIDDTVLVTQATSIIKMMRLTLLESSSSRVPFSGVSAFYEALHSGGNPFFYVSSSPWNLFEFLDDFMRLNDIVSGPMLLRDFGIDKTKFIAGPHRTHKLAQIRTVLEFHPDLPFILVGDSGQHDPEIYTQIIDDFPKRILSVYIRDVGGAARDQQVQALASKIRSESVDMLLVPDTLVAATHASSNGYIDSSALTSIAEAVRRDGS